ncbi:ROK family protein [Ensifer sp. BR816]|uniref:ROK family protein n=1 Tax=Rhizobium sp. (strain BR816) TaxID=1057002 RepID=UPI0003692350|nr:ROK family protein [Ensifer sp. BR816]
MSVLSLCGLINSHFRHLKIQLSLIENGGCESASLLAIIACAENPSLGWRPPWKAHEDCRQVPNTCADAVFAFRFVPAARVNYIAQVNFLCNNFSEPGDRFARTAFIMPALPDLSLNERRLVELIFKNRGVARVDLAQLSGMTGASVTRLIGGLLDLGLLSDEPDRSGAQGQPRRLLRLQANRFFAAGVTFSIARMEVVIIDLGGSILATRTVEVTTGKPEEVAEAAEAAVNEMLAALSIVKSDLVGLGVSVPGNFGTASNLLKAHPFFPAFEEGRAIEAFRGAFEIACHVENDGTAAALGEYVFANKNAGDDPLFFIHIGHGVGGGAVIYGKPYRGANGNACLPGVLYPYDQPRPSGQDLLATLKAAGFYLRDVEHMNAMPAAAGSLVSEWVSRAGAQLRQAVRLATAFFDPARIVVGGRLPSGINKRLVETILSEPIEGPSRGLLIAPVSASQLGVQAGAVGAGCVPFFRAFFTGAVASSGSPHLNGRRPIARSPIA